MITEQEKQELLNELEKRMDGRVKRRPAREASGTVLKKAREKWFENELDRHSLMADAIGDGYIAWQVWDAIRKLTCVVCGRKYVRQLSGIEEAPEIAEKICQYIYDLAVEFKEGKGK